MSEPSAQSRDIRLVNTAGAVASTGGGGGGGGGGLPIAETFRSIQGEGMLTGVPSLFIRVAGCNLRCTWCDTPYASWAPETDPAKAQGAGVRSVESLIAETREAGLQHIVLTGGEPMMFPQTGRLVAALRHEGFHVTIETAGAIDPSPIENGGGDGPVVCDLMSISPKLSTSTPKLGDPRDPSGVWSGPTGRHESRRLNTETLQNLWERHPTKRRQLKFVISEPSRGGQRDLDEVQSILTTLRSWESDEVFLMPEGVASPSPEHTRFLLETCLRTGYRYCARLHIALFGNIRGT